MGSKWCFLTTRRRSIPIEVRTLVKCCVRSTLFIGSALKPKENDGSRTLSGIYSKKQQLSMLREARRKSEYESARKANLNAQQRLTEELVKQKSELTLFNYGGPGGSGWRNDRGPVKAHINQTPEKLFEKIKELEKHKLNARGCSLVLHRGKKLRKGVPLRKQGIKRDRRCGYETIMICPAPDDLSAVSEHWRDCVFVPTGSTALYDYTDDLDIPGSLAQQQIELHRNF